MIRTLPVAQSLRRAFCLSVMLAAAGPAFAASTPTTARIKTAVEAKGIKYFVAIDQQQLGAGANLPIRKSTLVLFGNPPLGVQFIQANPYAGLDWPVRMLVRETADGSTEIAYTDFAFIAERYGISGKDAQLKMASDVAATIADEAGK